MAPGRNVFLVGPGYIGGEVLEVLSGAGYSVTTLVRRREHGEQLVATGGAAAYVLGQLDDREKIAAEAAKADVVVHAATADHLPSAQAVLDGVRKRAAEGKGTIYIQYDLLRFAWWRA